MYFDLIDHHQINQEYKNICNNFLIYLLAYSQEHSPSLEANLFSASQEIPTFSEPGSSLPHSQEPAIFPFPEPDQSSSCPPSHLLNFHLNIILTSKPWSSKWSRSFRFPHQNPICPSPLLYRIVLQSVYTYLLTPWCRVLLEKLTGLQLVKKFPAFHGIRRFTTALTSVRHLSLSWASPI